MIWVSSHRQLSTSHWEVNRTQRYPYTFTPFFGNEEIKVYNQVHYIRLPWIIFAASTACELSLLKLSTLYVSIITSSIPLPSIATIQWFKMLNRFEIDVTCIFKTLKSLQSRERFCFTVTILYCQKLVSLFSAPALSNENQDYLCRLTSWPACRLAPQQLRSAIICQEQVFFHCISFTGIL